MFATCGSSELELVWNGSLVLVGCLATPPRMGTGRVGCRTCSVELYRQAARAPKSPGRAWAASPAGATGNGVQHAPRLPDPEIVEGGEVHVHRDHGADGEVRAEAGEEGRDDLVARLAQDRGRGDRGVEPRLVDPLEARQERIDPRRSPRRRPPVDEDDL